MRIFLTRIYVEDQDKALEFYTEKLGFAVHEDVKATGYRWLTLVSPSQPDGAQLLLEAADKPDYESYQTAVREMGMAATIFEVDDLAAEYERLQTLGVLFTLEPEDIGPRKIAILNDGCGNLIQLNERV